MTRPPVVLDTNILILSIFWEGRAYDVVKTALDGKIKVFISMDTINELKRVLTRDFSLKAQEIDDIVHAVLSFSSLIEPQEKIEIVEDDPEDNRIIECGTACSARFIVTQDKHLLKLGEFRDMRIINPSEFMSIIE